MQTGALFLNYWEGEVANPVCTRRASVLSVGRDAPLASCLFPHRDDEVALGVVLLRPTAAFGLGHSSCFLDRRASRRPNLRRDRFRGCSRRQRRRAVGSRRRQRRSNETQLPTDDGDACLGRAPHEALAASRQGVVHERVFDVVLRVKQRPNHETCPDLFRSCCHGLLSRHTTPIC